MKKRAIINFVASMSYQVLSLLVGLLIPKYYTEIFGSVYNGLNSSTTQIMSLLQVLTFGIFAVSIRQMFKYIAVDDKEMIGAIYYDTAKQYRKMGYIFLSVIIPIAALFPLAIQDDLSYWIIVIFLAFRAISSAMEYFFQAKYSVILIAHNESYVVYIINIILLIIASALHLAVLFTVKNIVLYQFVAVTITLLRLAIVSTYVHKKYPFLKEKPGKEYTPPKDGKRKDAMVAEIAGMVIDSTDLLVLSTFSGLVSASIYSVYNFVVSGLGNVLSSCREAVFAGIGKSYYQNSDTYKDQMDRFESVYLFLVFFLYSVCIVLFRPFIEIYTAKMDANYVATFFPILFVLARMTVNFRIPAIVAVNTAGHFKQVKMFAVHEAIINLLLSVILVQFIGIYGVLIGTIAGAAYRTPLIVNYANRQIIQRQARIYWAKIVKWSPVFAVNFVISLVRPLQCFSLLEWMGVAIIVTLIQLAVCMAWVLLIDKKTFNEITKTAKKLIRK